MDSRSVLAVVLGVVSVACATGALERNPSSALVEPIAPQSPPGTPGHVIGLVRHHELGYAIAGALVIVQCRCLEGARETTTDNRGMYSFHDLPPGKYTVQVLFKNANVNKTFDMPSGARMRANFNIDPDLKFDIEIGALAPPLAHRATIPA